MMRFFMCEDLSELRAKGGVKYQIRQHIQSRI